jgi:hypothetical protein
MELGVRVAILAPTILFTLSLVWGFLFRGHLEREIKSQCPEDTERKIDDTIFYHFIQVFFADALVLFIMNGLILILEFSLPLEGVIQLLIGFIFGATGLIASLIGIEREGFVITDFALTIAIVGGQFGFLATVGTTTQNPILAVLINPWVAFVIGFLLTYPLLAAIAYLQKHLVYRIPPPGTL